LEDTGKGRKPREKKRVSERLYGRQDPGEEAQSRQEKKLFGSQSVRETERVSPFTFG
jgi:hypothetical protein